MFCPQAQEDEREMYLFGIEFFLTFGMNAISSRQ